MTDSAINRRMIVATTYPQGHSMKAMTTVNGGDGVDGGDKTNRLQKGYKWWQSSSRAKKQLWKNESLLPIP